MKIYNLDSLDGFPLSLDKAEKLLNTSCFIACSTDEVVELKDIFKLDEDTMVDCANFDENIRLTSYKSYDFISFIFFNIIIPDLFVYEVNIYVGKKFIILACKDFSDCEFFIRMIKHIDSRMEFIVKSKEPVAWLYYHILDAILSEISTSLERLEDYMQSLESRILERKQDEYFDELAQVRKMVHYAKKQLRSMLYIGDQMTLNENKMIPEESIHYFNSLDIRLNKIYDFANSLQEFAATLLNLHENKITMDTNNIVNKLTVVTVLFGPPTIIAGIYGMNFTHMPELDFKYGYPLTLCVIVLINTLIFIVLKKKNWI